MSNYQFISSDIPLAYYDNYAVVMINGRILVEESQNKQGADFELRIIPENSTLFYKQYTNLRYCNYIEWMYSEKNALLIIEYTKSHLRKKGMVELWDTWLGEKGDPIIKRKRINEITVTDIKEIWGKTCFQNPECLQICP